MMSNPMEHLQFPQPTRPVHAQDSLPYQELEAPTGEESTFVVDDNDSLPSLIKYYSEEADENVHDHKFLQKLYTKVEDEMNSYKTSIKDGDVETSTVLNKFEKFLAKLHEKLMKFSNDHEHFSVQQRGGRPGIDLDRKLQRFKVRTVNLESEGGQGQGEAKADEGHK